MWLLAATAARDASQLDLTLSALAAAISGLAGAWMTWQLATRQNRREQQRAKSDDAMTATMEQRRLLDLSQSQFNATILARLERTEHRADEADRRADVAETKADQLAGELHRTKREHDSQMQAMRDEFNTKLEAARRALRAIQRAWADWYMRIPPDIAGRLPEPPQSIDGASE